MTETLAIAAGWALAGILLSAAAHKVRNRLAFRGILYQYRLLPERLVPAAVPAVIAAEAAAGLALLDPGAVLPRPGAPFMAALLLGLYTGAIAVNLLRGRTAIDCGCGGEATPLSAWLLARNSLLLGLAWLAGSAPLAQWSPGLYLLAAATTVLLWSAYAIGNQLLANRGKDWPEMPAGVSG